MGQNLFAVEGLPYDPVVIWQWSILGGWFGEKKNFMYGAASGSNTGEYKECIQFLIYINKFTKNLKMSFI